MSRESRIVRTLAWFFVGHRVPLFALTLVLLYKLVLVTLLVLPRSASSFGQFAEEFKIWCFGYDPATGKLQIAYVFAMLAEPLVLGAALLLFWGRDIKATFVRRPRALVPSLSAALVTVLAGGVAFGALRRDPAPSELPFPAEELRTSLPGPELALEDQDGTIVSLSELRGKVVILTGVYTSCGTTCPMIMAQSKRALAALSAAERADVVVVAVTLDPEHDDRARRSAMTRGQGLYAPQYHLLGGDPAAVDRALDDLSIARQRNPKTGVIEHANLFSVVDRRGRVAYRFTIGERQERWLTTALRLLVREGS
jgi:protein SCO1